MEIHWAEVDNFQGREKEAGKSQRCGRGLRSPSLAMGLAGGLVVSNHPPRSTSAKIEDDMFKKDDLFSPEMLFLL